MKFEKGYSKNIKSRTSRVQDLNAELRWSLFGKVWGITKL